MKFINISMWEFLKESMHFPEKWRYNQHQAIVNLWQWMIIKQNGQVIQSQYLYFNTEIGLGHIDYEHENSQIEYQSEEIVVLDASALLINCFAYLYWIKVMSLARENCIGKLFQYLYFDDFS